MLYNLKRVSVSNISILRCTQQAQVKVFQKFKTSSKSCDRGEIWPRPLSRSSFSTITDRNEEIREGSCREKQGEQKDYFFTWLAWEPALGQAQPSRNPGTARGAAATSGKCFFDN